MKALLSMILALSLVGCAAVTPPPEIIVKYKYIINTIPSEMLDVPPQVGAIDLTAADDKVVGAWLLDGEKRSLEIEGKLKTIKELQDKRLEEAKKLPADEVIIK